MPPAAVPPTLPTLHALAAPVAPQGFALIAVQDRMDAIAGVEPDLLAGPTALSAPLGVLTVGSSHSLPGAPHDLFDLPALCRGELKVLRHALHALLHALHLLTAPGWMGVGLPSVRGLSRSCDRSERDRSEQSEEKQCLGG